MTYLKRQKIRTYHDLSCFIWSSAQNEIRWASISVNILILKALKVSLLSKFRRHKPTQSINCLWHRFNQSAPFKDTAFLPKFRKKSGLLSNEVCINLYFLPGLSFDHTALRNYCDNCVVFIKTWMSQRPSPSAERPLGGDFSKDRVKQNFRRDSTIHL